MHLFSFGKVFCDFLLATIIVALVYVWTIIDSSGTHLEVLHVGRGCGIQAVYLTGT